MTRVALFPSAFHPSLGGVEELTGQLAKHLRAVGVKPLICTNRWPRSLAEVDVWEGISVRRYPFRLPEKGIKAWLSFRGTSKAVFESLVGMLERFGTEVVHVQCVSSQAWYAAFAAERLGIPLVVSVQGERTMDANMIYQKSAMYNRLLRSVLSRAQAVTACSHATLADIQKFWGTDLGAGGRVIYNGIGAELFEEAVPWRHPTSYFLALGRMVPQKGFSGLLKAYQRSAVNKMDLLLAGEGPERGALEAEANALGISQRVHFVGRACRIMVRKLLAGAKGLVVPSLREPMGIVALEGMAAGKPLLASRVDGLAEIAFPGEWCRQHAPEDLNTLAENIRWLADSRAEDAWQAQRVRAREFLWQNRTTEYLETYRQAVALKRGANGSV